VAPEGEARPQRLFRRNAHEIPVCDTLQETLEVLQITFAEGPQAELSGFTNQPRIS